VPRRRIAAVILLVAAVAVAVLSLARQGDESAGGTTTLKVAVDAGDGSAVSTWSLTCEPAGGDHPAAAAACAALASVDAEVFEPLPDGTACTMIYGGPQTATVTGTLDGSPVDGSFSRDNGCEIDRWERLSALLAA